MPAAGSLDVPARSQRARSADGTLAAERDLFVLRGANALNRPELAFDPAAEAAVADYFRGHGTSSLDAAKLAVRHPLRLARMLWMLPSLPLLSAKPSECGEGLVVRLGLLRKQKAIRALVRGLTAVLVLPDETGVYAQGAGKSTKGVRNRISSARRAGITWHAVEDTCEREALVQIADRFERANPREAYRQTDANNVDMLDIDLWLLARSADGTPLLLAVFAVDGEWAVQRYFRTVTHSDEASLSRWLMVQVAVDALVERGVRYLADTSSPITLEPGLRYFQRLVGFRLYRVKVER